MRKKYFLAAFLPVLFLFCSCSRDAQTALKDGYYTAEQAFYDETGWKYFLTIYVHNNRIVTVEYNAKNSNGLLQSWDMAHLREIKAKSGVSPVRQRQKYIDALVLGQDAAAIALIPESAQVYAVFKPLAEAAMAQAREGRKEPTLVVTHEE
ncbi:MAG: FMN-binding protein [Deltaproteobacteria bacterium]|nr:FMN-binding protein [Deltaproteobacteria bacterium]